MNERNLDDETKNNLLRDRWETIVRRSAAATVRRVERKAAVERFCGVANRCALAVGLFLVVKFPFDCAVLEATARSASAYCETLTAASFDAETFDAERSFRRAPSTTERMNWRR